MNEKKIQKNVLVRQRKAITFFCPKDRCITVGADELTISCIFAGCFAMHNLRTEGRINRCEEGNVTVQKVRGGSFYRG